MMQWLARYVSRGRTQALLVAVISASVPLLFWISAAVVGLVTLRQGIVEGVIILLWTLLPAAAMAWLGEIIPLAALVVVLLLAALLRATASWQLVLLVAAAFGAVLSLLLLTVGSGYVETIQALFGQFFANMSPAASNGEPLLVAPGVSEIAGMFGMVLVVTAVCCLLMARWWQAMLDNPGGLRSEFHALRIEVLPTVCLVVLAGILLFAIDGFAVWAWLPMLPLLFAGIGLIHGLVAQRGLGGQWLVLMYCGLLLLPPVKQGLVVLAAADGWLNFRRRSGAEN